MRRRVREESGPGAPPAALRTYTGGPTNREKLAWLEARQLWWDATHEDPEHPLMLEWTIDGHDQVGALHWCGSVGAPCADPDCLCATWPEYRDAGCLP